MDFLSFHFFILQCCYYLTHHAENFVFEGQSSAVCLTHSGQTMQLQLWKVCSLELAFVFRFKWLYNNLPI